MENLIHDEIGLIHLAASIIALASGTWVLLLKKGSNRHKQVGYVYVGSMVVLIVTAFSIYRLFGGFGIFHIAAVVSAVTLLGGMIPVITKRPKNWLGMHFAFMYWSVMGLYAAFVSETLTRVPETPFFGIVGIATFAVMLLANLLYKKYSKRWQATFDKTPV